MVDSKQRSSNKIIDFSGKLALKKALAGRTKPTKPAMHVIAITSGKGGVGKTSIVANLGFALSKLGKRVLVLDADLGLGNLDVLLGIAPRYNLSHVIKGEKHPDSITINGPGNMKILPAASGIQELTLLTKKQKIKILSALDSLSESFDVLLIDTAAGISSNVVYFNVSAQEIMVVVTPELTSITDAYALMKVLSVKYSETKFRLLVNQVKNSAEAYDVYKQLNVVSDKFLDISIEYMGFVLFDKNVSRGVRHQKVVSEVFPDSQASKCFVSLAETICKWPPRALSDRGSNFMWSELLQDGLE
jgi:flagellar biosynthesis protein FlhG